MDYTPISAVRVVIGFSLTAFVALLPMLFLVMSSDWAPVGISADAVGGYREVMLGVASVVVTSMLVGLCALTYVLTTRLVRRPSRA